MKTEEPKMRPADYDKHWHLDRKVPVSIILVLILQFVMAIVVVSDVRKDVEFLKVEVQRQADRDDKQDRANAEALTLIRNDIKDMGVKLDRLIERSK